MRRRRSGWRDDAGVTLVELMVTLALTAAVLAMVATGVISLFRATNMVDVRTDNVDHARLAVATLSRDLRAAVPGESGEPAFLIAEPRRARFTAHLGDGEVPVLIDLSVQPDGRLVERETPPTVNSDGTVTYDAANERVRYVASYVFNQDDEPVLSYGTPTATDEEWFESTLAEADRRRIRLVRIDLSIARDQEQRVSAQRIATTVRVPNQRGEL